MVPTATPANRSACGSARRITGACRLAAGGVAVVALAASCSSPRSGSTRESADNVVALNNRGVGLMGQFDFDKALDTFARASAARPDQLDLQVNLAIAH